MDMMNEIEIRVLKSLSNSGSHNTGEKNTGGMNTGSYNQGDYNTGEHNIGDFNTGDYNSGDYNAGWYNTGNYNTGDFNICDDSTGVFCTQPQKIKIFDNDSDLTLEDWRRSDMYKILSKLKTVEWINANEMTLEEKTHNPDYKITGGYLKKINYKDAFAYLWKNLSVCEREAIFRIPNFDNDKFKMITGIEV